jgi:hypothetical protein
MDTTRPRFGDKTEGSSHALDQVEQRVLVYQRGLSAALAGLAHEKTDDAWYDAGWRHGAGIRALRTRKARGPSISGRRDQDFGRT